MRPDDERERNATVYPTSQVTLVATDWLGARSRPRPAPISRVFQPTTAIRSVS
jgi:hypothetical protein